MDPDKWERIKGKPVPDPWPEDGLDVPVECKAEYKPLHINEIGRLTPEKVTELYYLRSEIEALEKEKQPASEKPQNSDYELLAATIKHELDIMEKPAADDLSPEELQEIIFANRNVNRAIRRFIGSTNIPYIKRKLSKMGLLDPRLKARGGRGKTVPK